MNAIVVYKTRYGATRTYAEWISEELGCAVADSREISADELAGYDAVIFGGGLYAEVIAGIQLLIKNYAKLCDKKIAVFTTGITPIDCREYYDKLVIEKNFKQPSLKRIRVFNFPGKMIYNELSLPHKAAIKGLKKIMSSKENPTDMERLLLSLCDADGDFTDKEAIRELVDYIKG